VPQNIEPKPVQTTPQAITTPPAQNVTPEVKKEVISTDTTKKPGNTIQDNPEMQNFLNSQAVIDMYRNKGSKLSDLSLIIE
jgi:hypothetical protein